MMGQLGDPDPSSLWKFSKRSSDSCGSCAAHNSTNKTELIVRTRGNTALNIAGQTWREQTTKNQGLITDSPINEANRAWPRYLPVTVTTHEIWCNSSASGRAKRWECMPCFWVPSSRHFSRSRENAVPVKKLFGVKLRKQNSWLLARHACSARKLAFLAVVRKTQMKK